MTFSSKYWEATWKLKCANYVWHNSNAIAYFFVAFTSQSYIACDYIKRLLHDSPNFSRSANADMAMGNASLSRENKIEDVVKLSIWRKCRINPNSEDKQVCMTSTTTTHKSYPQLPLIPHILFLIIQLLLGWSIEFWDYRIPYKFLWVIIILLNLLHYFT